jgi:hypothetical protein
MPRTTFVALHAKSTSAVNSAIPQSQKPSIRFVYPAMSGETGTDKIEQAQDDVYKLETANTVYRMERIDGNATQRDIWLRTAQDDFYALRTDQALYFNEENHTNYGTPVINVRTGSADYTSGVTSFIHMIENYTKNELWVASRWRKHEGKEILECYVTVMTSPKSPVVTHNGITRSFIGMQEHIRNKLSVRPGVAIPTHAFAARVMQLHGKGTKQYMITSPVKTMAAIMLRAFPGRIYGPGIPMQHTVSDEERREVARIQADNAKLEAVLQQLEEEQVDKFWRRYYDEYRKHVGHKRNLLVMRQTARKWQTVDPTTGLNPYGVVPKGTFVEYFEADQADYKSRLYEIQDKQDSNRKRLRQIECWTPVDYEFTALEDCGLVKAVWNLERTQCILEYRDGCVFTNLDPKGSPESEYCWLRNMDATSNPSRTIRISDLASATL